MGARYEHMNMEAMRKVMPEKARLMDEIFGYRINGLCKPTYNKTTQELSDTITHIHGSWEGSDYITERGLLLPLAKIIYQSVLITLEKEFIVLLKIFQLIYSKE